MADNEQIIRDFFDSWGDGSVIEAFHRHLAPEVRWLNTGLPTCEGKDACLAFGEAFIGAYPTTDVEIVAIASNDDVVLVERIDYCKPADGSEPLRMEVNGSFRIKNGQITYWYDYFDSSPFAAAFNGDSVTP